MSEARPIPSRYQLVPTRLQERVADGRTRCHLCPWRCRIRHGQRGLCQAHVNREGTLYNLSYGIVSAMDLGPIESKPVLHFRPGTQVLSVGSYGCSFRCGGCHNLEISWGAHALDLLARGESRAAYVTPDELVACALHHGAQGIAFTYSEPAVWLEYVVDVADAAHAAGLYTVYVSNSFVTAEALAELKGRVDVLCSDIKSLDEDFYRDVCGAARVADILGAVETAARMGMHVETRTNVIPGRNDDPSMLRAIAVWIRDSLGVDSPWHLTKFFPAYHLSDVPPTPSGTLFRARDAALEVGLRNVHVHDDKGCDCATENRPVADWLSGDPAAVYSPKKCAGSCCGDEGVLAKKYEHP